VIEIKPEIILYLPDNRKVKSCVIYVQFILQIGVTFVNTKSGLLT